MNVLPIRMKVWHPIPFNQNTARLAHLLLTDYERRAGQCVLRSFRKEMTMVADLDFLLNTLSASVKDETLDRKSAGAQTHTETRYCCCDCRGHCCCDSRRAGCRHYYYSKNRRAIISIGTHLLSFQNT